MGRQIENAFINEIVKYLFDEGVIEIKGSYKKTLKNVQVELFFEENGFYEHDMELIDELLVGTVAILVGGGILVYRLANK